MTELIGYTQSVETRISIITCMPQLKWRSFKQSHTNVSTTDESHCNISWLIVRRVFFFRIIMWVPSVYDFSFMYDIKSCKYIAKRHSSTYRKTQRSPQIPQPISSSIRCTPLGCVLLADRERKYTKHTFTSESNCYTHSEVLISDHHLD